MTRKQKLKQIYLSKPELVNDDTGLILYVLGRCGAEITPQLEHAFRKMGNPEHWTRQCRILRAEDEQIRQLVNKKVEEHRHEQFVDYKYNAKVHTDNWREIFNN